jgi:hypothetical protein
MLTTLTQQNPLDRVAHRLRLAGEMTPALFRAVAAEACTRLPGLQKTQSATPLEKLIAAGAWTDAALTLAGLELPLWRLRRLIHDDGEWFCSLSREPNLPLEIDDTADARHEILPLAILCAFVEARRRGVAAETQKTAVPRNWLAVTDTVACDNFA